MIVDCQLAYDNTCAHDEDTGVECCTSGIVTTAHKCTSYGVIRQVGKKSTSRAGTLEICFNSTTDVVVWGTVCDAFFGTTASRGQVLTSTH